MTASAASPGRVDGDSFTNFEPLNSGSDLFNPTGDLMPKREGRWVVFPVALFATYDCEIGVAKSGPANLHDNLARSCMRLGYLLKLWLRLCFEQSVGEHRMSTSEAVKNSSPPATSGPTSWA